MRKLTLGLVLAILIGAVPISAQGGPGTVDFPIRDFGACINLPDFTIETEPDPYNTVFEVPGLFSINFAEYLLPLEASPFSDDEIYGHMITLLDTVQASDYTRIDFIHPEYLSAAVEFTLDGRRMFGMIYRNQFDRLFFLFADKVEGFDMLAIGRAIFPADEQCNRSTASPYPRFVSANYIELDAIERISLFRSAVGHDYWDHFESCRSMKHYFHPYNHLDWAAIRIFSPVGGWISSISEEFLRDSGSQVQIRSEQYPEYTFIIFHVALSPGIEEGSRVGAGMQIGTHIGRMTTSDITVGVDDRDGYHLVSFFDVMTNELFSEYVNRGVQRRSDFIITREQRDADPLTCDGETFTSFGHLPDWVTLSSP